MSDKVQILLATVISINFLITAVESQINPDDEIPELNDVSLLFQTLLCHVAPNACASILDSRIFCVFVAVFPVCRRLHHDIEACVCPLCSCLRR